MCANLQPDQLASREGYFPSGTSRLFFRETGLDQRQPVIILHGGPDFDHTYLLPDMDRLADSFHLIYYDQKGRGKSAANVEPEDVTLQSEIEELEGLREFFGLDTLILLGHSWGGLLALEYAIRYPERLSHLILMNTAPASRADYLLFREEYIKRLKSTGNGDGLEKQRALASTTMYAEGDPDTIAAYYRIHYSATLTRPKDLDKVIASLRSSFSKESILKSWAIEDRLMDQTWRLSDYDLIPKLSRLSIPTLVIYGDNDFVPVEASAHIAQAITGAHLVVLQDCGHFSYLEAPAEVHKAIADFLANA